MYCEYYNYYKIHNNIQDKFNIIDKFELYELYFKKLTIFSMNINNLKLDQYIPNLESIIELKLLNVSPYRTSVYSIFNLFEHMPNIVNVYIDNRDVNKIHKIKKKNVSTRSWNDPNILKNLQSVKTFTITGIVDGKCYRYFNTIFKYCTNLEHFQYGDQSLNNNKKISKYLHNGLFNGIRINSNYFSNLKNLKLFGINWNKILSLFRDLYIINLCNLKVLELYGCETKQIRNRDYKCYIFMDSFKLFCMKINLNLQHLSINLCFDNILTIIAENLKNLKQLFIMNTQANLVPHINFTKLTQLTKLEHIKIYIPLPSESLIYLFCTDTFHWWLVNLKSVMLQNVIENDFLLNSFCYNFDSKYSNLTMLGLINVKTQNCIPIFKHLSKIEYLNIIFSDYIIISPIIKIFQNII